MAHQATDKVQSDFIIERATDFPSVVLALYKPHLPGKKTNPAASSGVVNNLRHLMALCFTRGHTNYQIKLNTALPGAVHE